MEVRHVAGVALARQHAMLCIGGVEVRACRLEGRDRGRSSSGHYSRWPDPWRPKDDWGPLTAAVLFLIILAGLIFYGIAHL